MASHKCQIAITPAAPKLHCWNRYEHDACGLAIAIGQYRFRSATRRDRRASHRRGRPPRTALQRATGVAITKLRGRPRRERGRRGERKKSHSGAARGKAVACAPEKQCLNAASKPIANHCLGGLCSRQYPHQAGGWSVTWQGTGTTNNDFPGGTSIRDALESATNIAGGSLHYIPTGDIPDDVSPEAIIVVLAEEPYAEGAGDLPDLNWPSSRSATLARVQSWREQGIPVTTILLSGRPLWINPESINPMR